MFGYIPGINAALGMPTDSDGDDDGSSPLVERVVYDSGRIFVCRGPRLTLYTLGLGQSEVRAHLVPGLRDVAEHSIVGFGDWFAFSTSETVLDGAGFGSVVYVYSLANGEIVRALPAPRRGTIGTLRVQGDLLAALFYPERQSSGVLVWNWKTGRLIDTLHSTGTPTLSFAFLNHDEIALVRTNRSACSAQLDIYSIGPSCACLRSSLALPDAHPTKWYAKSEIYCKGMTAPPGCEPLQHGRGIVVVALKLRVRSPHNPAAILGNRKLSVLLVIQKQAIARTSASFSPGSSPTPWSTWSSNRFRFLSNVRLASTLHSSPVWGNRIVAHGPEPDQLALYDFCSVGAKAASVVWKAPSARDAMSIFSGGGGGRINGGVSVRAALAQRARTLVRANSLGVAAGWFEGMGAGIQGVVEQIPYVVSVRRGISGVESAMVDGERVVIVKNEANNEGTISSKTTSFVFSA
ncbi:hypothetical protein FRC07_015015 [Ceratobasidium sp. 392]|nr:hypothetical protein FRC07_015015 [Ceratobasidium sp. 392]